MQYFYIVIQHFYAVVQKDRIDTPLNINILHEFCTLFFKSMRFFTRSQISFFSSHISFSSLISFSLLFLFSLISFLSYFLFILFVCYLSATYLPPISIVTSSRPHRDLIVTSPCFYRETTLISSTFRQFFTYKKTHLFQSAFLRSSYADTYNSPFSSLFSSSNSDISSI